MDITTQNIDDANAKISLRASIKLIEEKIQTLAQKAAKTARIAGFRPGKVPVSAVLKLQREALDADARGELVREAFQNGIEKLGLDMSKLLGEPNFVKYESNEEGLHVEMTLAFRPPITLDGYMDLIPSYELPKVSADEIADRKNRMLGQLIAPSASDKEKLENGDWAKFDFVGKRDGVEFAGGSAKDFVLEIGSGQFIPGFEEGMVGMKRGESKDIALKFPNNYGAADLAGADVVFSVTLNEIQCKKLPELDEALLKQMLPDEEKPSELILDAKIKAQIFREKLIAAVGDSVKMGFVDAMVLKYDFALPKDIVEREMDLQFAGYYSQASEEERAKYKDDVEAAKKKREELRPEAAKSVKLTFIVDELAKLREINVSDEEVLQNIYMEAYRNGINPKEHLENYKQNGTLPAMRMGILEDKLFIDIFDIDAKSQEVEKAHLEGKNA